MNSNAFLDERGRLVQDRGKLRQAWLPKRNQMERAVALDYEASAVATDGPRATPLTTTMRQSLGLVVVAALLGGLLPFIVNWVMATRVGTVVPLAQVARAAARQIGVAEPGNFAPFIVVWDTAQTIAGMSPALLPGWLAALLSAFGVWINWPLRWLTWWIVYGAAVLTTCKLWGVPTTLQRFYALTGYAAIPLILLGLGPIPCLGVIAQFVGVVWMLVVYIAAVRAATGLDAGRATLAVIFPGAVVGLLAALTAVSAIATVLRFII